MQHRTPSQLLPAQVEDREHPQLRPLPAALRLAPRHRHRRNKVLRRHVQLHVAVPPLRHRRLKRRLRAPLAQIQRRNLPLLLLHRSRLANHKRSLGRLLIQPHIRQPRRRMRKHTSIQRHASLPRPRSRHRALVPEIPNLRPSRSHRQQHQQSPQSHAVLFSALRRFSQSRWYTKLTPSSSAPNPRKLKIRYPWLNSLTSTVNTFPIATASSTSACQRKNAARRQNPSVSSAAPNTIKNAEYVNCAYIR